MRRMRRLVLALVVLTTLSLAAQQTPPKGDQTHWERCRRQTTTPQADQRLTDLAIVGGIDLHAHHDPDSYPRQADAFEIARLAKGAACEDSC